MSEKVQVCLDVVCIRCQQEKTCIFIPVVDAKFEPLCAQCVSEMLAEAHYLLEAARKKLEAAR